MSAAGAGPHLYRPEGVEEAVALLSGVPPLGGGPTQRRHRTLDHLRAAFTAGRRRPEWVWAARDDDGRVVASVAGLAAGPGIVLDHWSAADPQALAVPLAAATRVARSLPEAEACLFAPPGPVADDGPVARWRRACEEAGWRHLVDRHHYEVGATGDLGRDVDTSLRLEPLTGPDDARLPAVVRRVLDGSLDAHDRALVAERGPDAAAAESVAALLDADPWECLRLAYDDDRPDPVGHVSWRAMPDGRGFVLVVGVVPDARGHGYGAQLLAAATRALVGAGSTTLVADTDAGNVPMARAFTRVGWPVTETRVDLVLPA